MAFEAAHVRERARCEGLLFRSREVTRTQLNRSLGLRKRAEEEMRARAWLDGVNAAERVAAADWPPCLRLLLVRLAQGL